MGVKDMSLSDPSFQELKRGASIGSVEPVKRAFILSVFNFVK